MPSLRWCRDHSYDPARVYVCPFGDGSQGPFDIIWDPAGRTEDEPGGWWLESDCRLLGIYPTLQKAKAAAQAIFDQYGNSVPGELGHRRPA